MTTSGYYHLKHDAKQLNNTGFFLIVQIELMQYYNLRLMEDS
jgi:hypothetical protein